MKIALFVSFWAFISIYSVQTKAQCVSIATVSYDTLFIGGGSNTFYFNFPKFDGSKGTLRKVTIRSVINMNYAFTLENQNLEPANDYEVNIGRRDRIFYKTKKLIDIFMVPVPFGPFNLATSDGVPKKGPDFISIPSTVIADDYVIETIPANTADFLGDDYASIQYLTNSQNGLSGPPNVSFNNEANENIHFTVTYEYCENIVLAADITDFKAVKNGENLVFDFTSLKENTTGYEIERSYDGRSFFKLTATRTKSNEYRHQFKYALRPTDIGTGIFRLKETEADNTKRYSTIRLVQLSEKTSAPITIFPNPAIRETQLVFNNTKKSDWKLEVVSANGQPVYQQIYRDVMVARINSDGRLKKGLYFIKASNLDTKEVFTQKLIIL